jgi:hypothetical protein
MEPLQIAKYELLFICLIDYHNKKGPSIDPFFVISAIQSLPENMAAYGRFS